MLLGVMAVFSASLAQAGFVYETEKEFLTTGVTASLGQIELNLIIFRFGIGPLAMDVSLLSLVGVLIAYLIARSLF